MQFCVTASSESAWHDYELAYISERGGRLDHLIPLVKAKVYAACTAVSIQAHPGNSGQHRADSSLRVLSIYNAKISLYLDKRELWNNSADPRQKQIRAAICLRSGYAPTCCNLCRDAAGMRSSKYAEYPLKPAHPPRTATMLIRGASRTSSKQTSLHPD